MTLTRTVEFGFGRRRLSRDYRCIFRLRLLARGGLGVVFVAHDEELNREVALKEIQSRLARDPQSRARFLVEAEVTARLEHPGIVPVHGLGHYTDGRPYYAMRLIRGESLKEAIARFHAKVQTDSSLGERSRALQSLLRRFLDVCNAVAYAHSRGVIHRDLKPSNIMLGNYGETLIVDWGLAKCFGAGPNPGGKAVAGSSSNPRRPTRSADTRAARPLGRPRNTASPEQARGDLDRLGREPAISTAWERRSTAS